MKGIQNYIFALVLGFFRSLIENRTTMSNGDVCSARSEISSADPRES